MKLHLCTLLLLSVLHLSAQQKLYPFKIEGTINSDAGIVQLNPFYVSDFYPADIKSMVATVKNRKFSFSGSLPYPIGFTLSIRDYRSGLFIIEPGSQKMNCNIDASGEVPHIDNSSMREFAGIYSSHLLPLKLKREFLEKKEDSLALVYKRQIPADLQVAIEKERKNLYSKSDSSRLAYVVSRPNSYVAFWNFINLFCVAGYESIFDSIYSSFSDSLKNTYTGEVLARKLEIAGKLGNGKAFPFFPVVDIGNSKLDYSSVLKNRYTLVDFWYSNCAPCIAQFSQMKETYGRYKDKGFEIVAISTDKLKYKQHWQNVIAKYELQWPQYWDQNGLESAKLSITRFPTNYLLDKNAVIVAKDLQPMELEKFLNERLGD